MAENSRHWSAAARSLGILGYFAGASVLWHGMAGLGPHEATLADAAAPPPRRLQAAVPGNVPLQGQGILQSDVPYSSNPIIGWLESMLEPHDPLSQMYDKFGFHGIGARMLAQLLYGILYYFCIAANYPKLMGPTQDSQRLQNVNEACATCQTSSSNCCLSYFCTGPRAAHTFDAAGICGYWPSLLLMTFCPCCTLFFMNSCTDLNERLGGQRKNWLMGILCTFFCSCCVVAQDAESLDLATGASTGCCGVDNSRVQQNGMMFGPQQMQQFGAQPMQQPYPYGPPGFQPQPGMMMDQRYEEPAWGCCGCTSRPPPVQYSMQGYPVPPQYQY